MANQKHYTLETLNELELVKKQITVNDKDKGEEKVVKTVDSAEIATIIAYMLGILSQNTM